MMLRNIVVITCLFIVACVSAPRKKNVNIGVEVPETWQTSPTPASPDSLWWQEFGDASLDSLIREALQKNFNLQIAAANVRAANAQAKIAGATLYPDVGLGASGSRSKQNLSGLGFGSILGGGGQSQDVISFKTTSYGLSLNVSWELDLWGRIRSDQSRALALYQSAEATFVGMQLSVAAQVSKVWFACIEAQRQLELAVASMENQRISTEQVQRRYESGLVSSLDLRLARSNLASNEARVAARQQQLQQVTRQLEILLGRYPGGNIEVSGTMPPVPAGVPETLPAEVLARRPDLIVAERDLAASYAGLSSARAARYPRISLTGSGGTSSAELKDLLDGDFSVWSFAGNILQPIFQGGRLKAGVKLAESQSDAALARYGLAVLSAFSEVESLLSSERLWSEREAASRVAAEEAVAARELAEEQYASGIRDFITMLDAQRSAYEAESQLLTVHRERLDARVDLYLALGGSFGPESEN